MFEGLQNIDWTSLGLSSIPKLMNELVSDRRQHAYNTLDKEVVIGEAGFDNWNLHSGISKILKSDLQYLLVPFLLEALQLERYEDKSPEYDILISFVTYIDFRYEGEIYQERAKKLRLAVWEGKAIFLEHLHSKNENTRSSAFALLCRLNEYYVDLVPILLEIISVEQNAELKLGAARRFYHAYVALNLLLAEQMATWEKIKPMPEDELFHPLYKWIYVKHEIIDTNASNSN